MKIRWLLFSCICAQALSGSYIIFDLGNVLIDTDSTAAMHEIGKKNLAFFALTHLSKIFVLKKYIHKRFVSFLNTIESSSHNTEARDPSGELLSPIMCDYFKGASSSDVKNRIDRVLPSSLFFTNAAEKNLVRAMCAMVFSPERFIVTQRVNSTGKQFVRECINAGHQVCIHSTWDRESFELLKKRHADFFNLFEDRIFISGITGLMKPDHASFQNLLTQLRAQPNDCIFIDDRIENIIAARACGIRSILCPRSALWYMPWKSVPDFDYVRKELLNSELLVALNNE